MNEQILHGMTYEQLRAYAIKGRNNEESLYDKLQEFRRKTEFPEDLFTHYEAWRGALTEMLKHATGDDVSYWQHELNVFERTWEQLKALKALHP